MKKFVLLYITFLFYIQQECLSEITIPDSEELVEDLKWIIQREENNLQLLEKSYKKFTTYYLHNIEDIEYDGELVRNQEIVDDELVNIKLKIHHAAGNEESVACYSEAFDDLKKMHEKFKSDFEQCRKSAYATYERLIRDFIAFKKAGKRVIKRLQKILDVCTFDENESPLCKRQFIPIKELSLLANHSYQYEASNIRLTDNILQNVRDCNALAIRPVAELATHFTDTLDEECDF